MKFWNFADLQICINHCHLFGIIWHLFIQLEGYRTAKFERLQTSQCWYLIIFVSSPFPRYIFLLRTAQEFSIQNWSTKSLFSFVDSSIKLDSILDSTNAWKLQELQEKRSSNGQLVFFKSFAVALLARDWNTKRIAGNPTRTLNWISTIVPWWSEGRSRDHTNFFCKIYCALEGRLNDHNWKKGHSNEY